MNGALITFIGNVTQQPELRYSQAGKAWATFSVAVNEYGKDKSGEKTEHTSFFNCKLFGDAAENFAASVGKGNRVMITGNLKMEKWTNKDGEEKTSPSVYVDEVAVSLRWATVAITRVAGNGQGAARIPAAATAPVASPAGMDEENPFV
jgi:single-strand DNA-binding protein